jgi:predicted dehydrogenase
MEPYDVAIVGTGPDPEDDDHDGYSMGYRHARSYRRVDGCRLAACMDVDEENAAAFAAAFELAEGRTFDALEPMLDDVEPDIVSLCTPPATHLDLVETCATHGAVRAIHCEKPMAPTFGESREIVDVCADADVQLTFNLQHRCREEAAAIKNAIAEGRIGDVERVEVSRRDLLQTGIHNLDLATYVIGDEPIAWVMGQIDYPREDRWYTGMHSERRAVGRWAYESGVIGVCTMGIDEGAALSSSVRIRGSEGTIVYELDDHYRIRTDETTGWKTISVEGRPAQDCAVETVLDRLESAAPHAPTGRRTLAVTSLVFGIWESARRRNRVSLPLDIDDNPLDDLVEGYHES